MVDHFYRNADYYVRVTIAQDKVLLLSTWFDFTPKCLYLCKPVGHGSQLVIFHIMGQKLFIDPIVQRVQNELGGVLSLELEAETQ